MDRTMNIFTPPAQTVLTVVAFFVTLLAVAAMIALNSQWLRASISFIALPSWPDFSWLGSLRASFTWAKFVYSIILVGLVALLGSEVFRIWLDDRTTIGSFHYLKEAETSAGTGATFAVRVVDRHAELRHRFAELKSELASERRLTPVTGQPITQVDTTLTDLKITVQEVPVTDILARLRRWVSAPRELTGTVTTVGTEYRATLRLVDRETRLANGRELPRILHFDGTGDLEQIAFDLACSLIWLDAAKVEPEIAEIGMEEFCHWTQRWVEYGILARRLERRGSLSDEELTRVRAALTALTYRIDNGAHYPKYWSLRADLTALLPQTEQDEQRLRMQNDWLTYNSLLDLDLKDRLRGTDSIDEAQAYKVLADSRPALPIGEDAPLAPKSDLWKQVFKVDASVNAVRRAAKATGFFRFKAPAHRSPYDASWAMGFAVGENLIATAAYNILPFALGPKASGASIVTVPQDYEAHFVFGDTISTNEHFQATKLPIRRILYLGSDKQPRPDLALLEIEGHDVEAFPPLKVDTTGLSRLRPQNFIALVGFPDKDSRLPQAFMDHLLGKRGGGVKRVMPGRVVSLPAAGAPANTSLLSGGAIVVDASTSGGTGGAPLIDLHSGRLVGINIGGQWQTMRDGKFAYVRPMEWLFPTEAARAYVTDHAGVLTVDALVEHLGTVEETTGEQVAMLDRDPEDAGTVRDAGASAGAADPEAVPTPGGEEPAPITVDYAGYDENFLGTPIPLPVVVGWDETDATDPLRYVHHSIVMNKRRRFAFFTAANIDGASLWPKRRGRTPWLIDPRIPAEYQVDNALYIRNDFDRGQLTQRMSIIWGDEEKGEAAEQGTQYYTNATPQHRHLNQRTWLTLENSLLDFVQTGRLRATVFSGPVFDEKDPLYRDVQIPLAFWKILVTEIAGEMRAVGYVLRQSIEVAGDELLGRAEEFDVINSQITIREIEMLTGLDFGPVRNFAPLEFYGVAAK